MKEKLKNPYFWLSLVALIFTASGIDFNQLTSWSLLASALVSIVQNPVSIVAVITAFLGIWNDNSTKGLDGFKNKNKGE
jgi:phi LC3 family holin